MSLLTRSTRRRKGGLAARVLHRMGDLVRRDRHGCDRTPVMVLRQQAHDPRLGIIVIAEVGLLDLNRLQVGLVEQVARKLRAGCPAGRAGRRRVA